MHLAAIEAGNRSCLGLLLFQHTPECKVSVGFPYKFLYIDPPLAFRSGFLPG